MADSVGLRDLLEAGVHFGHQTHRWNPKMRKYIFMERNGIYILDLQKTLSLLENAQKLVRDTVARGGKVLFVGTKKQARDMVREAADDCGQYYVDERWLGGMLTNFQTIRQQIRRLKELERGAEENAFEFYTKKERLLLERERVKLDKYLAGVKDMGRLPGAIFVVDARREGIAVKEAAKLGIPVVHGSIFRFEGQVSVFEPYQGPCYRCLHPLPPPPELAPSCAEAGVLGVLPGVVGSIQAMEALKLVLGIGDSLAGRLMVYDALEQDFMTVAVKRVRDCPACGDPESPPTLVDYDETCRPAV